MKRVYLYRDATVEYEELHITYHAKDDSQRSISLYRKGSGEMLLNMGPVIGMIKVDDPLYTEVFDAQDFRDTKLFEAVLKKADQIIVVHWNGQLNKDRDYGDGDIHRVTRERM